MMGTSGQASCLLLVTSCLLSFRIVTGFAYELTVTIQPGAMECFYQPITKLNVALEIEYQVLEGAGMDIMFVLRGPNKQVIRSDERRKMGSHQIHISEVGDYEACFDNRYSHMTEKMVFFELYGAFDDTSFVSVQAARELAEQSAITEAAKDIMDVSVEEIKTSLTAVQRNIDKTKAIQSLFSTFSRKDRSIIESNYARVNFFSGIYLVVMMSVSLIQVYMIRSLFASSSGHEIKMST